MPTVEAIATRAGVAKSTVSLALNNKSGVSDQTRAKILAALEQLRAEQAAPLARTRRKTPRPAEQAAPQAVALPHSILALHPPRVDDEVFTLLLQGVRSAAARLGLHLHTAANEPNLPEDHVTRLFFDEPSLRPQGVLVIGARREEPLVERALALGLPCVLVARQTSDPRLSAVGHDDTAAAFAATSHLLDRGHRAVAFVGGDLAYSYTATRLEGYRKALQARGVALQSRWIALGRGRAATEQLLRESSDVTAIVFINDGYAVKYGLPGIRATERSVPQALAVVAFDDIPSGRTSEPPLTTVAYPFEQESARAVQLLLEQMRNPAIQSQQVLFRHELIVRGSSKPTS